MDHLLHPRTREQLPRAVDPYVSRNEKVVVYSHGTHSLMTSVRLEKTPAGSVTSPL